MTKLTESLIALYEGKMSFERFYAAHRKNFERMARSLLQRWGAPSAISIDDVVQDLMMEVPSKLARWDATRGPIESYVVFNAMSCAKRKIHKMRGVTALARADRLPTVGELCDSSVSKLSRRGSIVREAAGPQKRNPVDVLDALQRARTDQDREIIAGLIRENPLGSEGTPRAVAIRNAWRAVERMNVA